MHYLGGLSMAYSLFLALAHLQEHKRIKPLDKAIEWTFVLSLVTTAAVFWEFSEFTMDQVLGTNVQISLQNTIQDLFMGVTGASTMIGYTILKQLGKVSSGTP